MDDFWWGEGVSDGKCIGRLFRHNRKYLVFRVALKRGVVLSLHDLAKHAPFDSVSRRRGLADRVGAVTGVAIPIASLRSCPRPRSRRSADPASSRPTSRCCRALSIRSNDTSTEVSICSSSKARWRTAKTSLPEGAFDGL
jgi:hypothetical protein